MPKQMSWSVIAIALLLSIQTHPALSVEISGGTQEDQAQLLQISKDWVDAYTTGDLDALMNLMHEDALLMPHNQATSRGYDAVRTYFQSRIGNPNVIMTDDLQEIRVNGNWAIIRGAFSFEIASSERDGQPFVHNGRYLLIYEKDNGAWKLLRDMDNLNPVAEPG